MALWGNSDNVSYLYNGAVGGTVSVNYSTKTVTGTGTTFGSDGYAKVGDVIRIGFRGTGGTYFGDATIVSIASTVSLTIASTDGLSGAAIANTSYWVSELPQYTPQNPMWSENTSIGTTADSYVYGVSGDGVDSALNTTYETGAGWVGVTTYMDNSGNYRVKKEILVAMSGITTGPAGVAGTAGDAYPPA